MAIKTNVAEWLAFVETPWPEGWMIEEESVYFGDAEDPDPDNDFFVEHLKTLDPAMTVRIECGTISHEEDREFSRDLLTEFRAWRKKRETAYPVVEVPRTREAEFIALLEANGFKVPKGMKPKTAEATPAPEPEDAPSAPGLAR